MENINYALSFIDSEGKEQIINSTGDIVSLYGGVLFYSRENAQKAKTSLINRLKKFSLERAKYWHDEVVNNPGKYQQQESYIKRYKDALILQTGIEIREVKLTVI